MVKKCMSYCNTDKYIKLRNNIFYFTMELPRKNGKRRFFCKSLHTYNYYEAREKAKIMVEKIHNFDTKKFINEINTLLDLTIFDYDTVGGGNYGFAARRVSPKNNLDLLEHWVKLNSQKDLVQLDQLTPGEKIIYNQFNFFASQVFDILKDIQGKQLNQQPIQPKPTKDYTIREVLESMLKTTGVSEPQKDRKFHITQKNLEQINMNIDSNYTDFYKPNVIQDLCDVIRKNGKINGDSKRKHVRYIKELITHANVLEPDIYKTNLLNLLPKFDKTPKSEKNPHFPYSDEQLLKMFDPTQPEHTYFKKNPDQFWVCMIALFTGSRLNAVVTLQYDDIIKKDGIDCIQFIENHPLKKLKTEASERIVPIPKQLLDMGFVQYFQNQKQKLKKTGSDFIFPKCQTKNGTFNGKVVGRGVLSFLTEIGIRGSNDKKLDFHSFRKNASIRLQNAGVTQSYINDIIGWEGENTMLKSYSKHTVPQIKQQVDKLKYDFLQPHFDKWTEIMKKL